MRDFHTTAWSTYCLVLFTIVIAISCKSDQPSTKPAFRDLTEAVYSTALVVPSVTYEVYTPVSGILKKAMVAVNDTVDQGELMFQLDNQQRLLDQQKAELAYELAKELDQGQATVLEEIKASLAAARLSLKNDSIDYARQQRLWQQNIGSEKSVETKKLRYELSQQEVRRLENNLQRTQVELDQQVKQAKKSYKISTMRSDDFLVKSNIDGIVYEVYKEVGEAVTPQSPIAMVGARDNFILELTIDEVDVGAVQVGQAVEVLLDAYPEETFPAQVDKIHLSKDRQRQTFLLEASFTKAPPRLYNGLSGEANIIIGRKKGVLSLPSRYISADNQVHTPEGLVDVKKGISTISFTEILSGIDTSTVIYDLP